ncbi:MAG: hypothetical protein K9L17_06000 [Clostridiales bacterium]|nr:hypothetical protein [Clostridiales bacterium]MCF8022225.1 hypothetical protein [Clostridiales bacterium]
MNSRWLEDVKTALTLELRQIALMAELAQQLSSPAMRMEVICKINGEVADASTWNTIYASFYDYCPEQGSNPGCGPGYGPGYGSGYGPGYCPGYGPGTFGVGDSEKK